MKEIANGVASLPITIANVYFVGEPGEKWALIDSGTPHSAAKIVNAAEDRYGFGARPEAILLTHGHFDHSGSARELAEKWEVPIYIHPLDLPYVTGRSAYPPTDPTVGGAMAFLSRFFPPNALNLGKRVEPLPDNGVVPGLPDWKWLFTPGHSPGHVSYWRESDSTLLAGDAFTTVNLDSFADFALKTQAVSRPPAPVTCDWQAARNSVQKLAELEPYVVGCGHGRPMHGRTAIAQLHQLAANFPIPARGRYVNQPAATDEKGLVILPPPAPDPLPRLAAAVGGVALAGVLLIALDAALRKPAAKRNRRGR